MSPSEQVYQGYVNTCKASKTTMFFAKLFGKKKTLKQDDREFDAREFNNKPYLLEERRKA